MKVSLLAKQLTPETPSLGELIAAAKRLLNNSEAAGHIGVTPRTLEVWRCTKRHAIPYIKVGRLVKYRQTDLDTWLAAQTVGAAE